MTVPGPDTDLEACAREPIRIPGAIQPHGALLVIAETDRRLLQCSDNAADLLGISLPQGDAPPPVEALGDPRFAADVDTWLAGSDPFFRASAQVTAGHARAGVLPADGAPSGGSPGGSLGAAPPNAGPAGSAAPDAGASRRYQVLGHRTRQGVILEFEPEDPRDRETLDSLYPRLQRFLQTIDSTSDLRVVSHAAAVEVRRLTGFNRVLIYRFDETWNGTVIAEDGDGVLPSYLDLRFPASDIPAQARELYRLNRLRLIPDADYRPVAIRPSTSPVDGTALDLSFATLRSVSPVHLEYMRNMETAASMSVSIVIDGQLWGLISCHHRTPRRVSPPVRSACDFVGQFLAQHIGARQRMEEAAQRIALKRIETGLLARLARADSFQQGLLDNAEAWLSFAEAQGAAVGVMAAGRTPDGEQIRQVVEWLQAQSGGPVFATDSLAAQFPPAAAYADVASGVLAISVSRLHASYVMWFRPELVRTVTWGGDPRKPEPSAADPGARLSPRTSFARWRQLVKQRAIPWRRAEIDGAADFRNAILEFVLRRAEERAELTDELQRSNKELESFSYSVSHDLRAPFRHIVGYAELLGEYAGSLDDRARHYLGSIVEAALAAGRLVDDLLNFSQLNRTALALSQVDMRKLVAEARRSLAADMEGRTVEWQVGALPPAWGDPALLRQAVLNLLQNAVKYTRGREPAVISVSGEERDGETVFAVRDNGIGFDMTYVGKLFGVFQRLHRAEDFEGTGIGLALTKRVIERHGGWIRAEGEVDRGATFTFALPKPERET
ncbi:MAG: GAF domain-containing protein [Rhodospirillales bacterium]|nr:GAF domain-containing protein [Rhodospirillales bacterium]